MQSHPLADCAMHLPCPVPGALLCKAFCCAGYTPEVLSLLKALREQSAVCAKPPIDGSPPEHYLSLDGGTTAYYYVDMDEGLPAIFFDGRPPVPYFFKKAYL